MSVKDTSQEAYESIKPSLGVLHSLVFDSITSNGGATPCEIAEHTGILIGTVRNRITDLLNLELIRDGGSRRVNVRGRKETVYVVESGKI